MPTSCTAHACFEVSLFFQKSFLQMFKADNTLYQSLQHKTT